MIVAMELLYPSGFPLLGAHCYDKYLHVLTRIKSDRW